MSEQPYSLSDLLRLMERLRDPETGCPWDLDQDFHSIVPSTIEECYELAQAIADEDHEHVAEELGDVLFQVVFYAQLGQERELFTFAEIVNTLVEKLIRRHPHVFADGQLEGVVTSASSVENVKESWESIKQAERNHKNLTGLLDDIPQALPALSRAQKLQKRAAQVNFDWESTPPVLDKVYEELAELKAAISSANVGQVEEEMGDVMFSCVNLARHLGLDAEQTLRCSSSKFQQRFQHMEAIAISTGSELAAMDDEALDALWERAKAGSKALK
ncbi:MAG: ATP diphosphatase [Halioglobus sp.]|jgi:ATP diphosphatase